MSVLTNFLTVYELNVEGASKKYVEKLNEFRKTVEMMEKTFDSKVSENSEIGKSILKKEAQVFWKFWNEIGFIPEEFQNTCLGTKKDYNYLTDLSTYPVVKVVELKNIAEKLGLVILPMDYVDMDGIIAGYTKINQAYAKKINDEYRRFKRIIAKVRTYTGNKRLYMLAPVAVYMPWKEVTIETAIPKFFSSSLEQVSIILDLIIPAQRNLYKKISSDKEDDKNFREEMQLNFEQVEKAIKSCHPRLNGMVKQCRVSNARNTRADNVQDMSYEERKRLDDVHRKSTLGFYDLDETYAYEKQIWDALHPPVCLGDDPIIFAMDSEINILKVKDDTIAHVGLCFGEDVPEEIFKRYGMTAVNDERFESITFSLKA